MVQNIQIPCKYLEWPHLDVKTITIFISYSFVTLPAHFNFQNSSTTHCIVAACTVSMTGY